MVSDRRKILAFDTSAAHCAVAFVCGGKVIAHREELMARGQAERLLPLMEDCLADAGLDWRAIDKLAVCTGPGNFTGIRIAVAAARGLRMSLGKPVVGVTLFEALAFGRKGPVLALATIPRGGFHAQRFDDGLASGAPVANLTALPPLDSATLCVGAGAAAAALELGLEAFDDQPLCPVASVAFAAAQKPSDPDARPAPFYLRPADAAPSAAPLPMLLDDA